MLVAVESILVQVSPRSLLGVTIGSDSPDIVVVGADGSGNGGSHPTTSSNSPRKLPKPSLSLPIPSANTFSPISISVGLDPTQSASTSNNAPTATPTSTIGTASQGKTGACNDAVSSPCTYASPVGTNGVDIISSAGALPPGATPSGSDGSVQITSDGLNSSVSSGSPLHPSATVSSNNAPAAVGDPNSDNNNDPRYHPITSVARALVPIAVVVVVGVLVIGAVVLRRKRNRHREGGYDDYLPYHGEFMSPTRRRAKGYIQALIKITDTESNNNN
ncbi:hypothetical protein EDD21DRAFT_425508 [Dissophora ornata]|nr:hypothetical protein EDD21DRAFT_425508 [Dissophora ornata]